MEHGYHDLDPYEEADYGPDDDEHFAPGGWSNDTEAHIPHPQEEQHFHTESQQPDDDEAEAWANIENYMGIGEDHTSQVQSWGHEQTTAKSRQQSIKPDPPYTGYAELTGLATQGYKGASDIHRNSQTVSDIDDLFSGSEDVEEEPSMLQDENQTAPFGERHSVYAPSPIGGQAHQQSTPINDGPVGFHVPTADIEDDDDDSYEPQSDPRVAGDDPNTIEVPGFAEWRQSYMQDRPSPTESQLLNDGFEFHSALPESLQIAKFDNEAFRQALREVRPGIPRKQQWYAYKKALQLLDQDEDGVGDEYDPSNPGRDFPAASVETAHGCQCGGDSARCNCAPGHCGCSGCPRNHADAESVPQNTIIREEDEQDDVPMDIGKTPITPSFPQTQQSSTRQSIPGLGQPAQVPVDWQPPSQLANHRCQCGDHCQCPPGGCQCPKLDETPKTEEYQPDRLSSDKVGWLIKKVASQPSSPIKADPPLRYHHESAPAVLSSSGQQDFYTPQQGFTFVRSSVSVHSHATYSCSHSTPLGTPPTMTPIAPSRPDTPRPTDTDVRQSVEPEMPLPNWHRDSTPAYTDRSPSPSPVSRTGDWDRESVQEELDRVDGLSDTAMRDVTPTTRVPATREFHHYRARSRDGSVAPPSPLSYSRATAQIARTSSPHGSASSSRHLMPTSRSPHQEARSQSPMRRNLERESTPLPSIETAGTPIARPPIPPPPAPVALKPAKQRAKRKSLGVQGSKVEKPKSRNVTAKQRKATEKLVKQDAKDTKEAKEKGTEKKGGKVKEAVAKIEKMAQRPTVVQADGTPPRRSARNRAGGRVVSYEGMGG
jgi:hypothetical protein